MAIIKRIMFIILALFVLLIVAGFILFKQPQFGIVPKGDYLRQMEQSPNFKDGKFQNLNPTPDLTEGTSYVKVMWDFLFKKYPRVYPVSQIPTIQTDLKQIPLEENVIVWFGHSSYYLQLDGKRYLVDPVLSGQVSPVGSNVLAFPNTDVYKVEDFPSIDYLLITHDHFDHLDYKTILLLKDKVNQVVCGLGVGAHFRHWGYDTTIIKELDWYQGLQLAADVLLTATPARHFSGRTFSRNSSLWVSYVMKTPSFNIYMGGDSGYDTHFKKIGDQYGPFDIAMLENGQYDTRWRYIHMLPAEVLQAAKDLRAAKLLPVHAGKFKLANHSWDDPYKTLLQLNDSIGMKIITPIIGEPVKLGDSTQMFKSWWEGLQ